MPAKTKITRLYIAFQFFFDLLVWLPVFYEYQRRMGLSDGEILSIQSVYYLSFCFLEIPTGYLADRFGYRQSMRAGSLIFVLANVLVLTLTTYWTFLAHFLFIALSRSLISGAANAYLYESLKMFGAKDEYRNTEGKARAYGLVGKVASWMAVGTLMSWHITLPYLITALAGITSFIIATYLPVLPADLRLSRLVRKHAAILDSKVVLTYLFKSPYLFLIVIQGVGIFMLGRLQVTFFQPILADKGFDATAFGWIMAIMTLFEALGSAKSNWLAKRITPLNAVFILTAGIALSFLGLSFSGKFGAAVGFSIFAYLIGLAFPIQKELLNNAITESGYRATILSIESMVDRGLSAWCISLFANMVGAGEISLMLNWAAIVTLATTLLLYLVFRYGLNEAFEKSWKNLLTDTA
jgi:MFS family permease